MCDHPIPATAGFRGSSGQHSLRLQCAGWCGYFEITGRFSGSLCCRRPVLLLRRLQRCGSSWQLHRRRRRTPPPRQPPCSSCWTRSGRQWRSGGGSWKQRKKQSGLRSLRNTTPSTPHGGRQMRLPGKRARSWMCSKHRCARLGTRCRGFAMCRHVQQRRVHRWLLHPQRRAAEAQGASRHCYGGVLAMHAAALWLLPASSMTSSVAGPRASCFRRCSAAGAAGGCTGAGAGRHRRSGHPAAAAGFGAGSNGVCAAAAGSSTGFGAGDSDRAPGVLGGMAAGRCGCQGHAQGAGSPQGTGALALGRAQAAMPILCTDWPLQQRMCSSAS